nr:hypothetical protein [Escherichia coli]NPK72249.1 hypothetical protein [Escherichia coli]NPS23092.1 hypothetical protein [Escherichia coli]
MGILKSLFTLGKSFISQAEESIEETQGVRMGNDSNLLIVFYVQIMPDD